MPTFALIAGACFMADNALYMPYTFLPSIVTHANFSGSDASFVLSIVGVSDLVGRALCGFALDHPRIGPFVGTTASYGVIGVTIGSFSYCSEFYQFAIAASIYGFFMSLCVVGLSPLMIELFGLQALTSTMGLLMVFKGFGQLIGPTVFGKIFDLTHSYFIPCLVSFVVCTLGAVGCHALMVVHQRSRQQSVG